MTKTLCAFILGAILCLPLPANANEGAGLIVSDLEGALPKSLWARQPRSEITYLLKNLPPQAPSRAMQEIKRNMLISTYNMGLMEDDVPEKEHENILTIRLKKLYEMGLWKDALKLYSKTANTMTEDDNFTQIGVILILNEKGLPTACLESKVLGQNFNSPFWTNMKTICEKEFGNIKAEDVDMVNSTVLQAALTEPQYAISANNLDNLSPLELAIIRYKGQISYEGFILHEKTQPYVLKYYFEDSNFPEAQKEALNQLAVKNFLFPESMLDEMALEPVEIDENTPQITLIQSLISTLKTDATIPQNALERLQDLAPENPENYFYLQILSHISENTDTIAVDEEKKELAENSFSTEAKENYNFLKSALDIEAEFSNNPAVAYEKQGKSLQKADKVRWLESTLKSKLEGLTLLLVLSSDETYAYANKSGDKTRNNTVNVLKSLSTVGLIDQANLIAREELAALMALKLKEK